MKTRKRKAAGLAFFRAPASLLPPKIQKKKRGGGPRHSCDNLSHTPPKKEEDRVVPLTTTNFVDTLLYVLLYAMDRNMTEFLSHVSTTHSSVSSTTAPNNSAAPNASTTSNELLLRDFYASLLARSIGVMEHRYSTTITVEDVHHAAQVMGFEVPSSDADAAADSGGAGVVTVVTPGGDHHGRNDPPPDWFVRLTHEELETTLRCGLVPRPPVLRLLYLLYRGVQEGTVTTTEIPSPRRRHGNAGAGGGKHYELSSPVGVHAEFFQRELLDFAASSSSEEREEDAADGGHEDNDEDEDVEFPEEEDDELEADEESEDEDDEDEHVVY